MVWCVEPFVVCVYVCMYVPARGARGPRCRRAASSSRPSSGGAAPRTCVDFVYMCKCIGLYKRMFVCGSLDRSIHPSIEPSICPRIQHALNTHAPDVPEGDGGGRRTLQRIAAAVAIRHAPPGRATRAARAARGGSGGGRGGGGVCFCFVFAGCVGMDGVGVRRDGTRPRNDPRPLLLSAYPLLLRTGAAVVGTRTRTKTTRGPPCPCLDAFARLYAGCLACLLVD